MRALAALCFLFLAPVTPAAVQRARIDFDFVRELAARRAAEKYRVPNERLPRRIAELNYDDARKIEFRRDRALWRTDELPFQLQLFPRGGLFRQAVTVHEFSPTHEQTIPFDPSFFQLGAIANLRELPPDLGYAGFKLLYPLNRPGVFDELVVFQGASYFRALGAGEHYGLSARGLALDSGLPGRTEEFPRFSEFWIGKPGPRASVITLYALLEGPSVAGAYEFMIVPGKATFIDVRAALFFRDTEKVVGLAPLTSMFWYGENTDRPGGQMRPEVHDSDGLLVREEDGAQTWRPLLNPARPEITDIAVRRLSRFGLAQRDRNVHSYEDREAQYERRPTAWIQPREPWPPGAVRLIELPTGTEYADNIGAYWIPTERPRRGVPWELRYRIAWTGHEPTDAAGVRVVATREGARAGGAKGRLFWIDFVDPRAADRLPTTVTASANSSSGATRVVRTAVERYPEIGGWRAIVELEAGDSVREPVELRCRLRDNDEVISETWLYRWKP